MYIYIYTYIYNINEEAFLKITSVIFRLFTNFLLTMQIRILII